MSSSPVSPSPSLPPLLGLSLDDLIRELTATLQAGIRSSMDELHHAHVTQPHAPPSATLRTFLVSLLSTLQPSLQLELDALSLFLARNVFTLPPHVSETAVRAALTQAKEVHDEKLEREVDNQLAAVRAEIRAKEGEKRHLVAVLERAMAQTCLLEKVNEGKQAGGRAAEGNIGEVRLVTEEAEKECASAVRMMEEGGGGDAARGRRKEERLDEHGPLQCFVARQGVVGGEDMRAEELAVLRARLIG